MKKSHLILLFSDLILLMSHNNELSQNGGADLGNDA